MVKKSSLLSLWLALFVATTSIYGKPSNTEAVFPLKVHEKELKNGLRVFVVPTGFPNLVSLQIPVQTGSRNEVEPGKTGFAHFFEHMMFRGTKNISAAEYQDHLKAMGARQNAYTSGDYTNYHTTFAKEDLELMLRLEADRFQNLEYGVSEFKTEARAVLGEYNKNSANPRSKLWEVLKDKAFTKHTYKHTTMGFLKDIEDMPNQFEYSKVFFDRWYRPEYTAIIVAGDVEPEQVFSLVEKYWGDWQRGSYTVDIPVEPPAKGPIYTHVSWENPTPPQLVLAFRGPAFSADSKEYAALALFYELAFGEASELYQQLVIDEQLVNAFYGYASRSKDPDLYLVGSLVKNEKDMRKVRDAVLTRFAKASQELVDQKQLDSVRSSYRYRLGRSLDNTESIAALLASFVHFERRADTLNRLFQTMEQVTPEDIRQAAKKVFTDRNLIVTTLANGPIPADVGKLPKLQSLLPKPRKAADFKLITQKNDIPLLNIKIQFKAGSAHDPAGKEGLAALSASMISKASSQTYRYEDIQKQFYPLAASLSSQVDKELTTFTIQTHKDHGAKVLDIALESLLNPAFREEDFKRLKSDQLTALKVNLRTNNEEELGKERLQELIFASSSYAHPVLGTVSGIESITLDDVKNFVSQAYTSGALIVGINGDFSEAHVQQLRDGLNDLPLGKGFAAPKIRSAKLRGINVDIIEKNTRATAISFGHPIEVTRSHKDFAALWLARAWLGEHRSSMSHLYQRIRELRGMNYGDYAYIEAFPGGMYQFFPPANVARRAQIFEVWIRPVVPENGPMAFRIALYELDKLIKNGLSQSQFEETRDYLMKNVFVMTATQDQQLGYALDSDWYGIGEFTSYMRDRLQKLTVKDVNRAIKRYLSAENLQVVMITQDAEKLKQQLINDEAPLIRYDGEKPRELLDEDRSIASRKLGISSKNVQIVPVEEVFSGGKSNELAEIN